MADLTTLIEKLVEEKTFSLDAVAAIQTIRQKAVDLEKQLSQALTSADAYKDKLDAITFEHSRLIARENSVIEREKKMVELEKAVAVSDAVRAAQKDMFDRMFANRVVRESNITSSYCASPTGPVLMPNNSNITKEEG